MQPRTSRLAIWSLVLGILSLTFLIICLGPLFAIPAVICGHMANSKIKKSGGELAGQGLALGGMITGYSCVGISLVFLPMMFAIAIPNFVKARQTAQMNACINNLRQIDGAKNQWAIESAATNGQPALPQNIDQYLPGGFQSIQCPAGGIYTINVIGQDPACPIPEHTLDSSGD